MIQNLKLKIVFTSFVVLALFGCARDNKTVPYTYNFTQPKYDDIKIHALNDTLKIHLAEKADNGVYNLFYSENKPYISFYNYVDKSFSVYDLNSRLQKKVLLRDLLVGESLKNSTVYIKNFDSIFVSNGFKFYLFDSSGKSKLTAELQKKPFKAGVSFSNTNPPVVKDGIVYANAICYLSMNTLPELKKWRLIYSIEPGGKDNGLWYELPTAYLKYVYGKRFFDYNYCYNDKGNFVFSFPADSNIYETNLMDYHMAYWAKSETHKNDNLVFSQYELIESHRDSSYYMKDSYGPIYFDPNTKRYLRVAKMAITKDDYSAGVRDKKQSVIIMDDQFGIIGESEMGKEVLLNKLIILNDKTIFAQVLGNDNFTLEFVKLAYEEKGNDSPVKLSLNTK